MSIYESTDIAKSAQPRDQYSLKKILAIWFFSSLPMGVLAFVIPPFLADAADLPLLIGYWLAIVVGLVWQFILSIIVLKMDGVSFKWSSVLRRANYQTPVNPKTGKPNGWLFLWLIPFILVSLVIQVGDVLPNVDIFLHPYIKDLPQYDLSKLATADYQGAWWVLGLFLVTLVFNYFIGEEFLYRGILLPKMNGVFGKWDWFANGVLFGFYHLHKPQIILSTALWFGFVFAFPSKYFQSGWMGLIIHGLEGLMGLAMVSAIVFGIG